MVCKLCPRLCVALREETRGEGFCRMGTLPVVARAARHMWEEPCLSGTRGSGTVFFSGCSLGCAFCQNARISRKPVGRTLDAQALCTLFERVEALGVHNLNLVTPTHFAPAVIRALKMRKPRVPVVWNCGGYERPEIIAALRGLVDVYLPDLKYYSEQSARDIAGAPGYFAVASRAVRAMREQTGPARYDAEGLLVGGTMIRHLVLPLRVNESIKILDFIKNELPGGTPVSLMRQYTPMNGVAIKGLDRRLTTREYARARDHMLALGLPGYVQGKDAATAAFTPDFDDAESMRLMEGL